MDDLEFVNQLIKEGKLRHLEHPWSEHYQIVDHPTLTLTQDYEFVEEADLNYCKYTDWHIWTYKYTIHVKKLKGSLQTEWMKLDYNKLEAKQRRLDEWFSGLPDY